MGLAASRNKEATGGLTITHLASGQQFAAVDLQVSGQPLPDVLTAIEQASWNNPARRVQISCRDAQQATEVSALFTGLAACQPVAEASHQLEVSYRLDSPRIEELDKAFLAANLRAGTRVLESAAASYQRADHALTRERKAIDQSRGY